MAKIYSARDIAVLALRNVGVVAAQDTSAPENQVLVALDFLDMLLSEKSGASRLWFFVPQELTFTYPADADSCNVTTLLGANNGLDMVRFAYEDDTDREVRLLRRDEFDAYRNGGLAPSVPGRSLYIASDGDDTYTAYLRTVPAQDIVIRLTGQQLSPSVSGAVASSTQIAHGFERAWQRWMVNQLSTDIGNGPCARLPESRLSVYRGTAEQSWNDLQAYRAGGQRKAARFTRAWSP